MYKPILTIVSLLVLAGPALSQVDDVEYFSAAGPGGRVLPFSDAVRVGNLLFCRKLGTTADGPGPAHCR